MTLADALGRLTGKTDLDAQDALAMRQAIYGTTLTVTRPQVEALFRLNASANSVSPEWRALFIEATTDLVVRQQQPPGFVDADQANWLVALVSGTSRVRQDEAEMLIHVLESAERTPDSFSSFVLDLVKGLALASLSQRGRLDRNAIGNLKRVIFAQGGDRNVAVTRREAEALFDVNDALKGADSDPLWRELFVHAIAAAVLYDTPWAPDAATEARSEAWLQDTSVHPFHRIASAFGPKENAAEDIRSGFADLFHWNFRDDPLSNFVRDEETLEAKAAAVTADESHWLLARIGRRGEMDLNETALLAYIRANARAMSPELKLAMNRFDGALTAAL